MLIYLGVGVGRKEEPEEPEKVEKAERIEKKPAVPAAKNKTKSSA
jgi:hypothetical protein